MILLNLEVLVSTMHQTNYDLHEKMNIQSDAVIVNQCNSNDYKEFDYKNHKIRWINNEARGLSRSRNDAIAKAKADICILADDDLEYVDQYKELILEQFRKHPEADIIAFQVEGIEGKFKEYKNYSYTVNYLTSMKLASVEIAFRLDRIRKIGVSFNELFGAGSKYFMGEESIFLFNCLYHGFNIVYVPIKIANLHLGNSTWFNGYNKEYFMSKGAAFTAMSKRYTNLLIIQFAIRRYKLFKNDFTRFQAIKYMLKGKKQYLNN